MYIKQKIHRNGREEGPRKRQNMMRCWLWRVEPRRKAEKIRIYFKVPRWGHNKQIKTAEALIIQQYTRSGTKNGWALSTAESGCGEGEEGFLRSA